MKAIEVVSTLQGKAGRNVVAVWTRKCKTKKSCNFVITKRTETFVRTGISYANLGSVKNEIASGTREEVGSLPWGQWRAGFENYIIDHNGVEYVRLYPASFQNLQKAKVEYVMDGVVATYADVEPYLMGSEKRNEDKERPACFTVKAESIVTLDEAEA